MLKSLLPDEVKMNFTTDNICRKPNLTVNRTIRFSRKSFFYTIQGFTKSPSGVLRDIEGFIVLIQGSFKSNKPINITGIDKIHLKCDCINGCVVNGIREPILYSFGLDKPPGQKI